MTRIKRSDYIIYSRTLIRKLYSKGCFGDGSMYEDHLLAGFPDRWVAKEVLKALAKQKIVLGKPKIYGRKYYLNRERIDKIKQIIKEQGRTSVIPVLLMI